MTSRPGKRRLRLNRAGRAALAALPGLVAPLAVAVCALPGRAGAQTAPEDLTIRVGECVALETEKERYACYERQVEAARARTAGVEAPAPPEPEPVSAVPPGAAQPPPAGAATAAPKSAAAPAAGSPPGPGSAAVVAAGAARAPAPKTTGHDVSGHGAGKPGEFTSRIAALAERSPNEHLITLDNGQVWLQMTREPYRLRVGQDVRVYPTRWGNAYRLTVPALNGYIQVERIE